MRYFVNNTIIVGSIIGLIAIILIAGAFITGSIVYDFRRRNFGRAFAQLCIAIIACAVIIRYLCFESSIITGLKEMIQ